MGDVIAFAALLQKASAFDRKEEARQYKSSTARQIEMAGFSGNFERQAKWLLDHACKICGIRGIARLEIIMCKECATAYDKGFSYHPKKENPKE